jgi:hypothetical protein
MSREADDEMACRELVGLVTDYLESALSERDRMRFERHLETCTGCRSYLEQMRVTIRLAGKLTPESLSPLMRERLLRVLRDWKSDTSG